MRHPAALQLNLPLVTLTCSHCPCDDRFPTLLHCFRAVSGELRAWKIELAGSPPFQVQFLRVRHQPEKRNMLGWDDAEGFSKEVLSAPDSVHARCKRAR